MKTAPDLPGRAPDLLFVANSGKRRLKKNHLVGPADVVVEIISPESRRRDRGEKFAEYEQGGVREHWLIDPGFKQAEFFLRDKTGTYQSEALDANQAFYSRSLPGLWIKPAWFWKTPLPPLISILKKWELI